MWTSFTTGHAPNVHFLQKASPQMLKRLAILMPLDPLYWQLSCMPGDAVIPKGSVFTCWISHFLHPIKIIINIIVN